MLLSLCPDNVFETQCFFFPGKTLSLLCSTLAWLERVRADQQLRALKPDAGAVEWIPPVRHKIIYSSRLSLVDA